MTTTPDAVEPIDIDDIPDRAAAILASLAATRATLHTAQATR